MLIVNSDYVIYSNGIVEKVGTQTLNSAEGWAILHHCNEFGTYQEIDRSRPIVISMVT